MPANSRRWRSRAVNARVYKRTPAFRRAFDSLDSAKQATATRVFKETFSKNPFDPKLKTHQINRLSAIRRETVWSAKVLPDLRVIFVVRGNEVISLDIGNHDSVYD